MFIRRIFILFGLSWLFFLFGAGKIMAAPPADFQTSQLISSGLDGPTGFDIAPDGRIFILERLGKVKIYKNGQLLQQTFAELPSVDNGDRGLIGIAFDPDFTTNHFVYFYYTDQDSYNKLVRFDATTDTAANGPVVLYQAALPSQEFHVGGTIRFGPDGKLYLSVGDNGYGPNAQDLSNANGKILRLNKDGTIPSDNPFVGQQGKLPEIWVYGFRNPFRFQFDSSTGRLYEGDVGESSWEEVNLVQKGGNYGWPTCEGVCNNPSFIDPIYAYSHDNASSAITMGPVYRASQFPNQYQGRLFFGDYARSFIRTMVLDSNGGNAGVSDFDTDAGSVVDLKVGPDGSLYYVTFIPGGLFKTTYSLTNHAPTAQASADILAGPAPLTVHFSSAGTNDPDNDQLVYSWNFGDNTTSNQANPTKIYNQNGTYTVVLTVSDGANVVQAAPLIVQVGTPPSITITSPQDGSTYRAGDTISYAATGMSATGSPLPDTAFTTEVLLHHDTHIHPFLGPIQSRSGTFTIPTTGESSANTWYEIKMTGKDSDGLTTTKAVTINPVKVNVTFTTQPAGLIATLDGQPFTTPKTIVTVVGFQREVYLPMLQVFNGTPYSFNHWSDNGPPKHFITTPNQDTTFTAFMDQTSAFTGQYFNNQTLSGTPAKSRQDNLIDFDWGSSSPMTGITADNFSVRWTKQQFFPAGKYRFRATADDGIRVFVDNTNVIDAWVDQAATTYENTIDLTRGQHAIKVEYYENGGEAVAKMNWDFVSATNPTPTPTPSPSGSASPSPTPTPVTFTGYKGEYWNTPDAGSMPSIPTSPATLIRDDSSVNFTWGASAPDSTINQDHFVARWTKQIDFEQANYRFTATADDGVRIYLDGNLIIDRWIDQAQTTYTADLPVSLGKHDVKVEYYENTGDAVAQFSFTKLSTSGTFTGQYFDNRTLSGSPKLTRQDATVNFNWGTGSPDPTIPADRFSVRWTKQEQLTSGIRQFTIQADDGVRFWIDGTLIVNDWTNHATRTYRRMVNVSPGQHTLKMEYYENTGEAVAVLQY